MNAIHPHQPVGEAIVPTFPGSIFPTPANCNALSARYCSLAPLVSAVHGPDLADAFHDDPNVWTYMSVGPFGSKTEFQKYLTPFAAQKDQLCLVIIDNSTKKAVGMASYLRINPEMGSIEVGFVAFSSLLRRTPAATEAMYLMMRHAFVGLGYRRYEWKCDALNAPSRHAALRLGFQFEGVFRQERVIKGRNRDTAWFSVIDKELPFIETRFQKWLEPSNFGPTGMQKSKL